MIRISTAALLVAAGAAVAAPVGIDRSGFEIYTGQATALDSASVNRGVSATRYSDIDPGAGGYVSFPDTAVTVDGALAVAGTADYTSTTTSNITMDSFRFVGGVDQAGGVVFFDFFDAGGVFVDGFGVLLADAGTFIYNITINTPFDVAGSGFVQMSVDDEDLAGAGSTAAGRWFLGNAGATVGDAGFAEAAPDFNFNFEINGVPAPGAFALLGLGGLVATRRRR